MQKVLLEEFPDANLDILIVWLKMYDADSIEIVQEAARLFSQDERVTQFYDPAKACGREVAESLGATPSQVAWDVYLFYEAQDEWGEHLPQPLDWAHQLSGSSWAEADRLFQGDQLIRRLREIMLSLFQNGEGI